MIRSFRHKGLSELFRASKSGKIRPDLHKRFLRWLDALHQASAVRDLNVPGFDLHLLEGQPERYSIHVNGPWCITFEWIDGDAWRVDLVQYHWAKAARGIECSMTRERPLPTTPCNLPRRNMREEFLVTQTPDREPTHPGAILHEDVLPALKLSVSEAARQLGVTRQTLHRIIAGTRSITPEMALRLGRFCGNGPTL